MQQINSVFSKEITSFQFPGRSEGILAAVVPSFVLQDLSGYFEIKNVQFSNFKMHLPLSPGAARSLCSPWDTWGYKGECPQETFLDVEVLTSDFGEGKRTLFFFSG